MRSIQHFTSKGTLSYEEQLELNDQLCEFILNLRFNGEDIINYLCRIQEGETPNESQRKRGVLLFFDPYYNSYYLLMPSAASHKINAFFAQADGEIPSISPEMFGRSVYYKGRRKQKTLQGTVYSTSNANLRNGKKIPIGGRINLTEYVSRKTNTMLAKQSLLDYIKESNNV